ncbi:hypothetical protein NQZ68_028503 [Dissostichus eleginoides]|nr:hypothetical protein NQZ68_028503 [Dissostichus eleginoides]
MREEVGSACRAKADRLGTDLDENKNPGFALEANSLSEGSAEAPAPPTLSPVLIVEEPSGFTTVELCQHGGEVCLSTSEGFFSSMLV